MALEFFTGFDHYQTSDLTLGVASRFTTNVSAVVTTSAVRNGTQGVRLGTGATLIKTGLSNAATRIVGGAFRWSAVTTGTGRCWLNLSDGDPATTTNGQVGLMLNGSAQIEARRAVGVGNTTAGTLLGTSTNTLTSNTWYFIELVVTVHNSAGTVDVFVNGALWLTLSSQDTQTTANAYANAFGIGNQSGQNLDVDDLYTVSGSGGTRTSRLGDVKAVGVIASPGDGALAQFTPSTGTDNGAMVDDNPPSMTDYNESGAAGNVDVYDMPSIGVSGTVFGLNVHNYVVKTDAGACEAQAALRIGGTTYLGTSTPLSTTAGFLTHLAELSPASVANFTQSEIDAAQFGVKHSV